MSEEKKIESVPNTEQQRQNPLVQLAIAQNMLAQRMNEAEIETKKNAANTELFDKRISFLAERLDYLEKRVLRLEKE